MAQNLSTSVSPNTESSNVDGNSVRTPSLRAHVQGMEIELHGTPDDTVADLRAEYGKLLRDMQTIGEEVESNASDGDASPEGGDEPSAAEDIQNELASMNLNGPTGFH